MIAILPYLQMAWKALPWILVAFFGAFIGIEKMEIAHQQTVITTQAESIGRFTIANQQMKASVDLQNSAFADWQKKQADLQKEQTAAIAQAKAAAAAFSKLAQDFLGAKAPIDPRLDCSAFGLLLDQEIRTRSVQKGGAK